MNAVGNIVYIKITETVNIFDIMLGIWFIGAVIQIIRYILKRKKVYTYITPYILSAEEVKESEYYYLLNTYKQSKMQVACVPENVSPSIFGIFHPIIIFPQNIVSSKDLHFILSHEIQHYRNFDLHLKVILDLLVAVHWWNPFVYMLRKKYNSAIEFSNDYMVSRQLNETEKIEYAESLLNIAKIPFSDKSFDLSLVENANFKKRISLLVENANVANSRKMVTLILNIMFISIIMFISLFFVPEADYSKEAEEVFKEAGAFSITPDNAYIVTAIDGYKLYMNGEFIGTMTSIPEDLKEVPIYEEKTINQKSGD
ncbi:M56 family metallopeptidase [Claveliimonas bilis]|nr:M56 family metallopeptidase [Claveliimonas bilis]MCQ5203423.1 M56 family metallopeptidase [Mordavella massiliensis]